MKTWLLIDGSCFAHRAHHVLGQLTHEGMGTGVAFGMMRDIEIQIELHGASKVVLAFDHPGLSLRKQICPTYKGNRRQDLTDEEKEDYRLFYEQVDRLKSYILPSLGYKNVLEVSGYEADDILAQVAEKIPDDEEGVIATTDKDLLQCLRSNVRCYNPTSKKMVTSESFYQAWNVTPEQWASVKALAGCPTDNAEGIKGIGEKSAAGWFNGKLKQTSKKWLLINENIDFLKKNLPLVKLPFPGLRLPELVDDERTESKKIAIQEQLGIRSRRVKGVVRGVDVVSSGGFDI